MPLEECARQRSEALEARGEPRARALDPTLGMQLACAQDGDLPWVGAIACPCSGQGSLAKHHLLLKRPTQQDRENRTETALPGRVSDAPDEHEPVGFKADRPNAILGHVDLGIVFPSKRGGGPTPLHTSQSMLACGMGGECSRRWGCWLSGACPGQGSPLWQGPPHPGTDLQRHNSAEARGG